MNLRRILVLLVAVAALGTYLFVWELPQAEREAKKDKLFGVSQDAVTGISLTYPDREIELTKSDQGWRLVKPVDAAADETAVKTLITTLAGAEVQKTLDQMPTDLGPFGLDKPTVTVRLSVKDGTPPPAVSVGKNTAIGGKTYVRKGDEPKLYLTTTALSFGLNKQAKDLRNKDLLVFQDDDVKQVEIKAGDGATVTLTRKDKDAWTVGPGDHPADPDRGALLSVVAALDACRRLPRRRADRPEAVWARRASSHGDRHDRQGHQDAAPRRRDHRGRAGHAPGHHQADLREAG